MVEHTTDRNFPTQARKKPFVSLRRNLERIEIAKEKQKTRKKKAGILIVSRLLR